MKESWNYTYQLSKRFDWIFRCVLLLFITDIIVIVSIFLADVNNFYNNLIANTFIFKIVFGLYLVIGILIIVTNRGELHYHYEIKDGELIVTSNKLINASLNDSSVNKIVKKHIILNNVTKLGLVKDKCLIKLKGMLIFTSVYVNPDEIDKIYQLLLDSCPNIRNR